MRLSHQPARHSAVINRPECSDCSMRMTLARIEPDKPDHEVHTFECLRCGYELSEVVKFP